MGSKKKHRNRNDEMGMNEGTGNNPFGLDVNQLMGMLGGMDGGKINNLMNSLNQNGFNMENFNVNQNNPMPNGNNNQFNGNMNDNNNNNNFSNMNPMNMNGMNNGNINPMMLLNNLMNGNKKNNTNNANNTNSMNNANMNNSNGGPSNNIKHNDTEKKEDLNLSDKDPNVEMMLAVRKLVNKERKKFIDRALQLYAKGLFGDLNKNE